MSQAGANSSSGSGGGGVTSVTSTSPGLIATPTTGDIVLSLATPNAVVSDFDDFISTGDPSINDSTKLFQCNQNASFLPGTSTNTGIYQINSGSVVFNNFSGAFSLGASTITLNWVADLVQLSTTLEDFTTQIGVSDNQGAGTSNGVYFSYNQANSGGNWEAIANNNGTTTVLDTGVPASIGFNNFQITLTNASTVVFKINGTNVGSIGSDPNIPTSPLGFCYSMITNVGFTPVNNIDLFYYTQVFNTAR